MNHQIMNRVYAYASIPLFVFGFSRSGRVQAAPACSNNGGASPYVCVNKDGNPPQEDVDFRFDFSDPANPSVELRTGSEMWVVSSQVSAADTSPAALGDIKIDAIVLTADFGVSFTNANVGGPGATNVKSIVLDDPDPNWTGHSNLGGAIAGDLTASLALVQDATGDGGEIGVFTIGGDLVGNVTAPVLSELWIEGDALGKIKVEKIIGNELRIFGDLVGGVEVTDTIHGAEIDVHGSVASTALIRVADMTSWPEPPTQLLFNLNDGSEFAGKLVLETGIPAVQQVLVFGALTSTGSIDLTGGDLGLDAVLILSGTVTGNILNGGAVSGNMVVLGDLGGTATFNSITADGIARALNLDLGGTMRIRGDVAGTLGSVGHAAGDMVIEGDVTPSGTISIGGRLRSTGRILIDGVCDGQVEVDGVAERLSLIRVTGGVGASGDIRTGSDANGMIHIGPPSALPPLPDVPFLGSIVVDGDLNGRIGVVGCHDAASEDPLDICICGVNNGSVTLVQTGCSDTVAWSCTTGCP